MRTLVLGATGQVGGELARLLPAGEVLLTTRSGQSPFAHPCVALDAAEPGAVRALVEEWRPGLVFNAAAYTAVDRAESEPTLAYRVNADAVAELSQACRAVAARLVHFSTDYVFDGEGSRPYREGDAVAPIGVYGRSKRAGEEAVEASGADALVIRTAWVFSHGGHNFMRTMLRLAGERGVLRVVADQRGCPTGAGMLARAALHLAGVPEARGIVHVTGQGETTWHGFASAIVESAAASGLIARAPTVEPITTADFPTPARRPAYSVLDCSRAEGLGVELLDWRACLREELGRMRSIR